MLFLQMGRLIEKSQPPDPDLAPLPSLPSLQLCLGSLTFVSLFIWLAAATPSMTMASGMGGEKRL